MRLAVVVVRAVARHPSLLPAAIGAMRKTARRGWWRRPPFLPVPGTAYVRFRLLTQYGDEGATPPVDDVVSYLQWCRSWAGRGSLARRP